MGYGKSLKKLAVVAGLLVAAGVAGADPVAITSYDIEHTQLSGWGGWGHSYSGTIVSDGAGAYNYSGGSGTLNDGSNGANVSQAHLFDNTIGPVITLHLGATVNVNSISIFGGDFSNGIPGNLQGLTVSFGGPGMGLSTIAFGPNFGLGPVDDLVDLAGTGLESIATDTIVLSGFIGAPCCGSQYFPSIAEIRIDGVAAVANVPEPLSLALVGVGLVGLSLSRRKEA